MPAATLSRTDPLDRIGRRRRATAMAVRPRDDDSLLLVERLLGPRLLAAVMIIAGTLGLWFAADSFDPGSEAALWTNFFGGLLAVTGLVVLLIYGSLNVQVIIDLRRERCITRWRFFALPYHRRTLDMAGCVLAAHRGIRHYRRGESPDLGCAGMVVGLFLGPLVYILAFMVRKSVPASEHVPMLALIDVAGRVEPVVAFADVPARGKTLRRLRALAPALLASVEDDPTATESRDEGESESFTSESI